MAYRLAGTYTAVCNCPSLCPCPVDQPILTPDGQCTTVIVFDVREGNLDGTSLSDTRLALYGLFKDHAGAGDWTIGLVIDQEASDQQADALQRVISGQEGGPLGDLAGLIGNFAGVERGRVSFSDGDSPSASVEGKSEFSVEPFTGPNGEPTTTSNTMLGLAPTFKIGKGTGRSDAFGMSFDASYGETAEFEFSTETEDVHPRG